MARVDAEAWNERYRASELVWSAGPNQFVEAELSGLPPGRALDLACGEGRNAIWLARQGWQVTAVDFAQAGLDKGRTLAEALDVAWVCADATTWRGDASYDVCLVAYLQLAAAERGAAVRNAYDSVRTGGTFLWVGHDLSNFGEGVGGPTDPAVLMTAEDVLSRPRRAGVRGAAGRAGGPAGRGRAPRGLGRHGLGLPGPSGTARLTRAGRLRSGGAWAAGRRSWSDDFGSSGFWSPNTPAFFAASTFFSCLVKLRRMKTTATISATITAKPTHPATTLLSSGLGSEASARATTSIMTPLSQVWPASATADPGEQVVLRDRGLDVAGDQLEVLGRPGEHLELT